jgi:hypothetical protein
MKTFKSIYEFYDLPDDERMTWIGTPFMEEPKIHKGAWGKKLYQKPTIYFPIGLRDEWVNYGKTPGLIFVTEIMQAAGKPTDKGYHPEWFRVGIATPDDGDMDLDFERPMDLETLRTETLKFLTEAPYGPWSGTDYREVLDLLQLHLGTNKKIS